MTFSKVFIAAGWPDKIVRTVRGLHIIANGERFIVRDDNARSPFEMGVSFETEESAAQSIDGLFGGLGKLLGIIERRVIPILRLHNKAETWGDWDYHGLADTLETAANEVTPTRATT